MASMGNLPPAGGLPGDGLPIHTPASSDSASRPRQPAFPLPASVVSVSSSASSTTQSAATNPVTPTVHDRLQGLLERHRRRTDAAAAAAASPSHGTMADGPLSSLPSAITMDPTISATLPPPSEAGSTSESFRSRSSTHTFDPDNSRLGQYLQARRMQKAALSASGQPGPWSPFHAVSATTDPRFAQSSSSYRSVAPYQQQIPQNPHPLASTFHMPPSSAPVGSNGGSPYMSSRINSAPYRATGPTPDVLILASSESSGSARGSSYASPMAANYSSLQSISSQAFSSSGRRPSGDLLSGAVPPRRPSMDRSGGGYVAEAGRLPSFEENRRLSGDRVSPLHAFVRTAPPGFRPYSPQHQPFDPMAVTSSTSSYNSLTSLSTARQGNSSPGTVLADGFIDRQGQMRMLQEELNLLQLQVQDPHRKQRLPTDAYGAYAIQQASWSSSQQQNRENFIQQQQNPHQRHHQPRRTSLSSNQVPTPSMLHQQQQQQFLQQQQQQQQIHPYREILPNTPQRPMHQLPSTPSPLRGFPATRPSAAQGKGFPSDAPGYSMYYTPSVASNDADGPDTSSILGHADSGILTPSLTPPPAGGRSPGNSATPVQNAPPNPPLPEPGPEQQQLDDPIPRLIGERRVSSLVVLLGERGSQAPTLLSQLLAQPHGRFSELRLVGSVSNGYAGIGAYWDGRGVHLIIEGAISLGRFLRRLRPLADKAKRIKDGVRRNRDLSMASIGGFTGLLSEFTAVLSEIGAADFSRNDGGLAAALALAGKIEYVGSDGATMYPEEHLDPIWDMQLTVATTVGHIREDSMEPISDFSTPFGVARGARQKVSAKRYAAALLACLTYERYHSRKVPPGTSKSAAAPTAHKLFQRAFGVGGEAPTGPPTPGSVASCAGGLVRDLVDPQWLLCEAHHRASPAVPPARVKAFGTADFGIAGLLPDTTAPVGFSIFGGGLGRHLSLALPDQVLVLGPGEYQVLRFPNGAGGLGSSTTTAGSQVRAYSRGELVSKIIETLGATAGLAVCGLPSMSSSLTAGSLLELSGAGHGASASGAGSGRKGYAALGGLLLRKGKKEAIAALMGAATLTARLGRDWAGSPASPAGRSKSVERPYLVRDCVGGGFAVVLSCTVDIDKVPTAWLCLRGGSGAGCRSFLVCSGDSGAVVCYGTGVAVAGVGEAAEGAGVTVL
ncbi:hypothetical protein DFJ73DRAFT_856646 [Zopfochytrium polystomum]|nr:hypothetical protein DFJ73DRAFT_856646 [Zopfochytrium polystomum]